MTRGGETGSMGAVRVKVGGGAGVGGVGNGELRANRESGMKGGAELGAEWRAAGYARPCRLVLRKGFRWRAKDVKNSDARAVGGQESAAR